MNRSIKSLALVASVLALSACATPQFDAHPVAFTSNVPGTIVSFEGQSCATPCTLDIRDKFGFGSTYVIQATAGARRATQTFVEPTAFHGQGIVPKAVAFRFE